MLKILNILFQVIKQVFFKTCLKRNETFRKHITMHDFNQFSPHPTSKPQKGDNQLAIDGN